MPTVRKIFGVVDTYHKDWSELRGRRTQDQRKNSQVFVQGQIPAGGRKNTQVAGQGLSQGGGGKPKVIGQGLSQAVAGKRNQVSVQGLSIEGKKDQESGCGVEGDPSRSPVRVKHVGRGLM